MLTKLFYSIVIERGSFSQHMPFFHNFGFYLELNGSFHVFCGSFS